MYYIIININGTWQAYGDEFETYEEAKYQLECIQETDEKNGEHHDYKIYQAERVERVNKDDYLKQGYLVTLYGINKASSCTFESETEAIDKARELHANATPWETVSVEFGDVAIPYRVFVAERETGNVIEEIKGRILREAIEIAVGRIYDYETEDKACGYYEKDFYDIINEDGASYLYVY